MQRIPPLPLVLGLSLLSPALLAAQPVPPARLGTTVRPLSLPEALRLAAGASEVVRIAGARYEQADAEVDRAASGYWPQISGSASYTRTLASQFEAFQADEDAPAPVTCDDFTANPGLPLDSRVDSLEAAVDCMSRVNPLASLGQLPFGQANQWNFGLQGSWMLFDGFRTAAGVAGAEAARQAALVGVTAEEARLILTTAQVYYDAALSTRLLAIADSALALTEQTVRDTEVGVEVGAYADFDLLRARVARDNQRPLVIQRRAERDIAFQRLRQLLELPATDSLVLTTTLDAPEAPLPTDVDRYRSDTTAAARAPVLQADAAVEQADAARRAAAAERWPLLQVSSNYARLAYPGSVFPSWNEFVSDWSLTLGVSVPLFTGGRIGAQTRAAEAVADQVRYQREQVVKLAALDARDAYTRQEAARAAWEASQGTVEQATRAYEIAQVRFREGISVQTELTDARLALQNAAAVRATASRDLRVARLRVALLADLPLAN